MLTSCHREPPRLARLEQECCECFVAGALGVEQAAVKCHRFDLRNPELAVSQRFERLAGGSCDRAIAHPPYRQMPAPAPLLALESVLCSDRLQPRGQRGERAGIDIVQS